MTDSQQHDIAISFLSKDETLACKLAEELEREFSVFVFSKEQEKLAGTDGLETLRSAFRDESRLNVVLYRDGWGESPWTRLEQTAITDRAFC